MEVVTREFSLPAVQAKSIARKLIVRNGLWKVPVVIGVQGPVWFLIVWRHSLWWAFVFAAAYILGALHLSRRLLGMYERSLQQMGFGQNSPMYVRFSDTGAEAFSDGKRGLSLPLSDIISCERLCGVLLMGTLEGKNLAVPLAAFSAETDLLAVEHQLNLAVTDNRGLKLSGAAS
ncbi:MAG: hypothetical protein HZC36_16580 [Armatimonadetes bacterium]|nr:hypothetical protein [Armatimonadota bacterium]